MCEYDVLPGLAFPTFHFIYWCCAVERTNHHNYIIIIPIHIVFYITSSLIHSILKELLSFPFFDLLSSHSSKIKTITIKNKANKQKMIKSLKLQGVMDFYMLDYFGAFNIFTQNSGFLTQWMRSTFGFPSKTHVHYPVLFLSSRMHIPAGPVATLALAIKNYP